MLVWGPQAPQPPPERGFFFFEPPSRDPLRGPADGCPERGLGSGCRALTRAGAYPRWGLVAPGPTRAGAWAWDGEGTTLEG
jgi:hypothetical protein